ncbi:MAG: threonine-phosphate decarboxylase CobD [Firmicutes bacterium]|nr:threonine-phosphate decarboxylase CobD [Bacillota bacterium]
MSESQAPGSQHGGDIWGAALAAGLNPTKFVDFSASINPLGPPPRVLAALQERLSLLRFYPDPESRELRQALAGFRGLPPEYILAGNGGAEVIYLLARLLAGRRAVILQPTFSEYQRAWEAAGGRQILHLELKREGAFQPSLRVLTSLISSQDVVFWCNPNNPTGTYLEPDVLLPYLDLFTKKGALVILDESFVDFAGVSLAGVGRPWIEKGQLILLGSLTKIFALPGLRLGYALAAPQWCNQLNQQRDPWSVNLLAQVAGVAAVKEKGFLEKSRNFIAVERERLVGKLRSIPGLDVLPSQVNFLLLELKQRLTAAQLRQRLLSEGVLIRAADNFPFLGPGFFRVAVRVPVENDRLVDKLQVILANAGDHPAGSG